MLATDWTKVDYGSGGTNTPTAKKTNQENGVEVQVVQSLPKAGTLNVP